MAVDAKPDFHVVSLRYKLLPSDRVTYVSPPPVEFEEEEVRFRLADGKLTCEMKTHFPTVEAARAVVERILRAWEADADLRWNQGELGFKFDRAEVIDGSPLPPGVIRVHVQGAAATFAVGTVSVHVSRNHYPEPPGTFRLNPDAESLLLRYQGYLGGREPLLSMAYFSYTVLTANAPGNGRRKRAASKYRIHVDVLRKMGDLTSCRGDRSTARKAAAAGQPLTDPESAWLQAAVKTLIWRLGDTHSATVLPLITLSDLPRL